MIYIHDSCIHLLYQNVSPLLCRSLDIKLFGISGRCVLDLLQLFISNFLRRLFTKVPFQFMIFITMLIRMLSEYIVLFGLWNSVVCIGHSTG